MHPQKVNQNLMNKRNFIFTVLLFLLSIILFSLCNRQEQNQRLIKSPDGKNAVLFQLKNGKPKYTVIHNEDTLIKEGAMGFILREDSLHSGFEITGSNVTSFSESWEPVWGTDSVIENHYNELVIHLQKIGTPPVEMDIIFRSYDNGVAFRYEWPEQKHLEKLIIVSEETSFSFTSDMQSWWIPADCNTYENLYRNTLLSEIEGVNTPVTFRSEGGLHVCLHEANLTDFAGMTLIKGEDSFSLKSDLVPWPDGIKVKADLPHQSPWRVILITKSAADLVESHTILNLNEENKIKDVSWIRPMKYIGIWWSMHTGQHTWHIGDRHGATTERTRDYIDFAAENNIDAVRVEGWNKGWESWWKADSFNFVTPYPDFDLKQLAEYAEEKNVEIIGHHETGGNIPVYERQMDSAFRLYQSFGVNAVKTGYAGPIRPEGQYHHGQYMVNHYRRVVETAAKYHIMLDVHEPIKPTGISRTWPNMMTREGVRGMEYNAWSAGNPPEHTCILPFTRMVAGPIDYTPGIFDLDASRYRKDLIRWNADRKHFPQVHGTLARQLALFVILYSPLQMAADLIENYEDHPAFEFIRQVPADWDETKVLEAEIGDYVVIARRNGRNWYIGAITDENARNLEIRTDFLGPETDYTATIYLDGEETDPESYKIEQQEWNNSSAYKLNLKPGGGQAVILVPLKALPTR